MRIILYLFDITKGELEILIVKCNILFLVQVKYYIFTHVTRHSKNSTYIQLNSVQNNFLTYINSQWIKIKTLSHLFTLTTFISPFFLKKKYQLKYFLGLHIYLVIYIMWLNLRLEYNFLGRVSGTQCATIRLTVQICESKSYY